MGGINLHYLFIPGYRPVGAVKAVAAVVHRSLVSKPFEPWPVSIVGEQVGVGNIDVFHLIEIFAKDIGPEKLKEKVTNPLKGLNIAPYYGCQVVRPRKNGEEVENPQYFEELIKATGATATYFPERLRCCGASLIMTSRVPALNMVRILLESAEKNGADVIATTCPMCQVNLECYQNAVNEEFGTNFHLPILYFTQLFGIALGISPKKLGFGIEMVSAKPIFKKLLSKEAN